MWRFVGLWIVQFGISGIRLWYVEKYGDGLCVYDGDVFSVKLFLSI